MERRKGNKKTDYEVDEVDWSPFLVGKVNFTALENAIKPAVIVNPRTSYN